jgi:dihydrolipoamide dehydrogenase
METSFDVVVLGAGPGGYVAAIRASQLGLRTAIVERRYWGGVCLNVGCIPSKALLRNADLVHLLRHDAAAFGITLPGGARFDYAEAIRRSRRVADGRARGVRYLMRKNKITELEGTGTFLDPHTLEVTPAEGAPTVVSFRHAIVATGASPRLLPGTRRSERVVTYERQILDEAMPGRLVIVGGGPIGVELAWVARAYGAEVTIVERLPRLLPTEDEEASRELRRHYERSGVEILTGASVDAIEEGSDGVRVAVTTADGGRRVLEADRVLQAVGFAPNTSGYGLDRTGVALAPGGGVAVDAEMRTSVPHLFAIGDVTGQLMLAHVAEAMGIVAAEAIAGLAPAPLDLALMPRATYSHPQVASFGATEAEARARGAAEGFDVKVARFPFQANGKAQGIGDYAGFVKLVAEAGSGRLLGAHLVGPEVTELLPELTLAARGELTGEEIARNVHAHPTLSEAVKDAAHALAGHAINL